MQWRVIDTGAAGAAENMRIDDALLEALTAEPILHFYEWTSPSITYGHFLKPEEFLRLDALKRRGIEMARRPTGGGIVFHFWDMAFSLLVPASAPFFSLNTLENYAFVNRAVLRAVAGLLDLPYTLTPRDLPAFDASCGRFCMAQPTKYDVVLGGKKVAGAAQRRKRQGYLHQGTIALVMPDPSLLQELLLPGTRVLEAMQVHTLPLVAGAPTEERVEAVKAALREQLTRALAAEIF